jgi:hypothetical protein
MDGGWEVLGYDAVRAASQISSTVFELPIPTASSLTAAREAAASYGQVFGAIANGRDVLTDEVWADIDREAHTLADIEYPLNARGTRSAKAERRHTGCARARRAELFRALREGFTLADLAKRRAINAAAKALQQAYYERPVAEQAADAYVVAAIAVSDAVYPASPSTHFGTWVWG